MLSTNHRQSSTLCMPDLSYPPFSLHPFLSITDIPHRIHPLLSQPITPIPNGCPGYVASTRSRNGKNNTTKMSPPPPGHSRHKKVKGNSHGKGTRRSILQQSDTQQVFESQGTELSLQQQMGEGIGGGGRSLQQAVSACTNNGGFNGVLAAYGPQLNAILNPHFCKIWSSFGLSTLITNYAVEKVGCMCRLLLFSHQPSGPTSS